MYTSIEVVKSKKASFFTTIILLLLYLIYKVLFKIITAPFYFFKYKILKRPRELKIKIESDNIIVENEKYHLTLIGIEKEEEVYSLAKNFCEAINEDTDTIDVFTVKNHNFSTDIDGFCVTSFILKLNDQILLQRIRKVNKKALTSDLIQFFPSTGTFEVIEEIGLFELIEYDEKKKTISGYNLNSEEDIYIKILDKNNF